MRQNLPVTDHETHVAEDRAVQTNIPALNAAVEAARAGELGRGAPILN